MALTLILLAVMLVDWIRNGVDADALVGAAIVAAAMAYRRWARRRDEPDREA